jgi:hypothetical protein
MAKSDPAEVTGAATRGAIYTPVHGERKVNIYPIQEHELTTIGICNNQVSLWASVASACAALIAACLWDMATSPETSKSNNAIAFVAACVAVLGISIAIAFYYWKQKQSEIQRIKSETTTRID